MTGKKVRVFWPVDSQWYIADVQRYDGATGEHLLRYPDGDTEWVRIGEDHTTNQREYKEYVGALHAGSVADGPPRSFPPLPPLRTASSMSSFGMYGARQTSFGPAVGPHLAFSHSFSSKAGGDFGPPVDPGGGKGGIGGGGYSPAPPPFHAPQRREEGVSGVPSGGASPGTRDGAPPWLPGPYHPGCAPPPPLPYAYMGPPPPASHPGRLPYGAVPPDEAPPPPRGGNPARDKSKKALPKAWTKSEDERLLDLVLEMKHPLKWSVLARALANFVAGLDGDTPPARTGKQCRERYVNHLNPRLKRVDFGPLEDATIWRLYATVGTQWAKMSKVIPGRTDNNLKNRFHNLKRQLQREEEGRKRAAAAIPERAEIIRGGRVREIPTVLRTRIEGMWEHRRHLELAAADTCQEQTKGGCPEAEPTARRFGPFVSQTEPVQCGRCGLLVPSAQCGNEVCARTKWCRACTRVSLHLCGNVLRECLNLRKDPKEGLGAEQLLHDIWNRA